MSRTIEVGAPVWKKGSVVKPVHPETFRLRVAVEGVGEIVVHQHDIRSFSYLRTRTS